MLALETYLVEILNIFRCRQLFMYYKSTEMRFGLIYDILSAKYNIYHTPDILAFKCMIYLPVSV